MSAAEFSVWWDEYRRNPWGEQRDSINAAVIARTIADYAGKTRKTPAKIGEFLPDFERTEQPDEEPDPAAFFSNLVK